MVVIGAYAALFAFCFGAASILPIWSEPVVVAMTLEAYTPWIVCLVATAGNVGGAVLNWWLARYLTKYQGRRWFPIKPDKLHKAQAVFQKYGAWTLLFSWAPVGGDSLTVVAGLMRVPILPFLFFVTIGKGARYVFLIWGTLEAAGPL